MAQDAKILQVSDDGGNNWYTLPGNTADLNREASQLTDTIFGETFSSSESGLINWSISGNALYRGFAGYNSVIRKTGTSTSFTGENLSQVGTSQTYRIDDNSKSVWDWTQSVTIKDSGSAVSDSNIDEINYVQGEVTFVPGYTVSGPVTADGNYLPTSPFGKANSFTLTQSADTTDTTDFETAQSNGGFMTMRPTLLTSDLELGSFYRVATDFWDVLKNRDQFVIEVDAEGNGNSVARGIYKVLTYNQSGDVGGDEEETVNFGLNVPDQVLPFSWKHLSGSNIPTGLKKVLDAWEAKNELLARYLPDGEGKEGYEGNVIVTDTSLSSGIDAMVEASVTLQGTGKLTKINETT